MDENKLWAIRAFVYQHFAETASPPSLEETAAQFDLTDQEAVTAYEELHQRHALFLRQNSHEILMANPFSGVETSFQVHTKEKIYFANCAWDSLGIPAALHTDAHIQAICAQSSEPIEIAIGSQQVEGTDALAHFLIPFKDWYQDLAFT